MLRWRQHRAPFRCQRRKHDAVKALIAAGANVNQVSSTDAMSPLVQSIITGHFEIAKFLLERGADPNLATKKAGVTALWAVVDARYAPRAWSVYPSPNVEQEMVSHLDLMKMLLDRGAKPNARLIEKPWFRSFGDSNQPDPAGATAFYRAAQSNDVPAMRLLVGGGANPSIPTNLGTSPLLVSAGMQQDFQGANFVPEARMETIRYLVEEVGADVNAKDSRGYSVLHQRHSSAVTTLSSTSSRTAPTWPRAPTRSATALRRSLRNPAKATPSPTWPTVGLRKLFNSPRPSRS